MIKFIKNIKISKKYLFYILVILTSYFIVWVFNYDITTIKAGSMLMPIVMFYIISPFLLLLSIWRVFTHGKEVNVGNHEEEKIKKKKTDIFTHYGKSKENGLLKRLEIDLSKKLIEYNKKMSESEKRGKFFITIATVIPFFTWVYTLSHHAEKVKLDNLWALTFSSTTAGFILLSIGVTMLRHSKVFQDYADKIEEKLFYLRKLRIIALSINGKEEFSYIYEKIYSSLMNTEKKEKDEKKDDDSDKNLSLLYGQIAKLSGKP